MRAVNGRVAAHILRAGHRSSGRSLQHAISPSLPAAAHSRVHPCRCASTSAARNGAATMATGQSHAAAAGAPAPPASAPPSAASASFPSSAAPASSVHAQYASLLSTLLSINSERKVRMGIETTRRLLAALGPDFDLSPIPVIHVAGSNGKGSTTVKIARALQMHGLRVGTYTSPHVSSFRERISVDGRMMSEEEAVSLLPSLLAVASRPDIPATFFELGTALAWGHFRRADVQVAVVEVGLGGRLDSTNVIAAPELSVVCSIALEHTQWLGDTIEQITREKAGILKPGRPALIGPSVPADIVRSVAATVGAGPIEQMQRQFDDYDAENAALAARAVLIAVESSPRLQALLAASPSGGLRDELVARGVRARPPCRFQQVRWDAATQRGEYLDEDGSGGPEAVAQSRAAALERGGGPAVEVVMDVCHNPTAFQRLFEKLRREYAPGSADTDTQAAVGGSASSIAASPVPSVAAPGPLSLRAVVGFSSDKSFLPCLRLLMQHCTHVWLVQADTPRAADAQQVWEEALQQGLPALYPHCTLAVHARSPYLTVRHALAEMGAEAAAAAAAPVPPASAAAAVPAPVPALPTPPAVLLCCGTFFIMSDVRRALGLPHPVDPLAVNEQNLTPSASSTHASGQKTP